MAINRKQEIKTETVETPFPEKAASTVDIADKEVISLENFDKITESKIVEVSAKDATMAHTHAGVVKTTVGTGGRAGRIFHETLVAK
jgi:hypothetical protein